MLRCLPAGLLQRFSAALQPLHVAGAALCGSEAVCAVIAAARAMIQKPMRIRYRCLHAVVSKFHVEALSCGQSNHGVIAPAATLQSYLYAINASYPLN
jgi:hypothetical protein